MMEVVRPQGKKLLKEAESENPARSGRAAATTVVQLGDMVPGTPYRVVTKLGQGGMGSVYEVEHVTLGRRFVLKMLHHRLANRQDVVGRMQNEWRMLARLEHPAIVSVTDAGRTEDGVPYYVMERLDGETLSDLLLRRGQLGPQEAAEVVLQVLSGLEAAHGAGAIHRDIKPQNLFWTPRGTKILDFGIAKVRVQAAKVITRAGSAIGTPRYMAPEQASGEPVDARADVYATGLVFYELIVGRSPFAHVRTPAAIVEAQISEVPERLDDLLPGIPEALGDVVQRWLAKNPADRPPSARAARLELEAVLPLLRPEAGPPESAVTVPGQYDQSTLGPALSSRRGPVGPVAGGLASASPEPGPSEPSRSEAGRSEAGRSEAGRSEAGRSEAGSPGAGESPSWGSPRSGPAHAALRGGRGSVPPRRQPSGGLARTQTLADPGLVVSGTANGSAGRPASRPAGAAGSDAGTPLPGRPTVPWGSAVREGVEWERTSGGPQGGSSEREGGEDASGLFRANLTASAGPVPAGSGSPGSVPAGPAFGAASGVASDAASPVTPSEWSPGALAPTAPVLPPQGMAPVGPALGFSGGGVQPAPSSAKTPDPSSVKIPGSPGVVQRLATARLGVQLGVIGLALLVSFAATTLGLRWWRPGSTEDAGDAASSLPPEEQGPRSGERAGAHGQEAEQRPAAPPSHQGGSLDRGSTGGGSTHGGTAQPSSGAPDPQRALAGASPPPVPSPVNVPAAPSEAPGNPPALGGGEDGSGPRTGGGPRPGGKAPERGSERSTGRTSENLPESGLW